MWNRIIFFAASNEQFGYLPNSEEASQTFCGCGTPTNSYYSINWQVLEDQTNSGVCGAMATNSQYVWGLGYIDDLVERDRNTDNNLSTGSLGINSSGLEQRIYVQHDAVWNVTALTNTSGSVLERFIYDPYGTRTVLTASWTSTSDSYNWIYSFQGGRMDPTSGLINFRGRWYSPVLGRFVQQDGGYWDGMNLYQADASNPVSRVDPMGTNSIALINPFAALVMGSEDFATSVGFSMLDSFVGSLDGSAGAVDVGSYMATDRNGGSRLWTQPIERGTGHVWDAVPLAERPGGPTTQPVEAARGKGPGEGEDQYEEIDNTQRASKKKRPSIKDPCDDWEGAPSRPKQNRIKSTRKSKNQADWDNQNLLTTLEGTGGAIVVVTTYGAQQFVIGQTIGGYELGKGLFGTASDAVEGAGIAAGKACHWLGRNVRHMLPSLPIPGPAPSPRPGQGPGPG